MVHSYTQDLNPPLISGISDFPLRNNKIFLHLLIELVVHRNFVFHHPLGNGTPLDRTS